MIDIIIAAILAVGIFFGGWFTRDLTKPSTQIINNENKTYVENKTESYQTSIQGQMTIVTPITNVTVNIRNYTNFNLNRSTNSNFFSLTNLLN